MTRRRSSALDELYERLDTQYAKLLADLEAGNTGAEGEENPKPVTFWERARILDTIQRYAADRAKNEPPKPMAKGKFHDLRDRYHAGSNPAQGRAGRGKANGADHGETTGAA